MDLVLLHLSGTLNFFMAPRFMQNLYTHAYNYAKFMNILCKIMTKTVHLHRYVNRSFNHLKKCHKLKSGNNSDSMHIRGYRFFTS